MGASHSVSENSIHEFTVKVVTYFFSNPLQKKNLFFCYFAFEDYYEKNPFFSYRMQREEMWT